MAATRLISLTVLLAECGYGESDADAAFQVMMTGRNRVECFADVVPALEYLVGRYAVGAITNGNADLERIGLAHYFSFVISARVVGVAKPDPEPFRRALSAGGVDSSDVLHVGDHPEHDVRGAHSVGMRTAWMNRNGARWSAAQTPDLEVSDMLDLVAQLESSGQG